MYITPLKTKIKRHHKFKGFYYNRRGVIPYSYKFSRGLIFAHFVCADLFSRTLHKTSKFGTNFRAISRKFLSERTFARINFRAPAKKGTKLQNFGNNFRAISRKLRFCAKIRENLSALKFIRIR